MNWHEFYELCDFWARANLAIAGAIGAFLVAAYLMAVCVMLPNS